MPADDRERDREARADEDADAREVRGGGGRGSIAGPCSTDAATVARITHAASKLVGAVHRACGGDDKVCGGDLTGEPRPPVLGWRPSCPGYPGSACSAPIVDCGDIAACIACIGGTAVDQAAAMVSDAFNVGGGPAVVGCQAAIVKETSKFAIAEAKALQKCWDARRTGKHSNACPSPGDGKAAPAIAKAESKKRAAICKACGGADRMCGGGDDLTPAAIGFAASCDAVIVPASGADCATAVSDLQSLVDCVDCVADFSVQCADAATVPDLLTYPATCGP